MHMYANIYWCESKFPLFGDILLSWSGQINETVKVKLTAISNVINVHLAECMIPYESTTRWFPISYSQTFDKSELILGAHF